MLVLVLDFFQLTIIFVYTLISSNSNPSAHFMGVSDFLRLFVPTMDYYLLLVFYGGLVNYGPPCQVLSSRKMLILRLLNFLQTFCVLNYWFKNLFCPYLNTRGMKLFLCHAVLEKSVQFTSSFLFYSVYHIGCKVVWRRCHVALWLYWNMTFIAYCVHY